MFNHTQDEDEEDINLDSSVNINYNSWYYKYINIYNKWDWFSKLYFIDWIISIIIIIIFEILLGLLVTPHENYLIQGDYSLSYPFTPSSFTWWMLVIVEFTPSFFISIYLLLVEKNNLAHELHHALLAWLESGALTFLITGSLKYICGRYRPDYFSRLVSDVGTLELKNGHLSFPSGHSSGSFFAMGFLFWYIVGKTKAFKRGHFFIFLLCGIPLYFSTWIAITRLHDYKHNYSDVLAGTIIGCISCTFGYFLNFESVFSNKSGKPRNIYKDNNDNNDNIVQDD